MYVFIGAHDTFPCLNTVVLTLQFKWTVMWDHHCRLWVSTTQIQRRREPAIATGGSCCANTIVCPCSWRPNYWSSSFHAGSTPWSHSFRDLSPSCPANINTIDYVFVCIGRALLKVLWSSNAPTLSYKGTQTSFTTGQYSPNFISSIRTQIRHGGEPAIPTGESYQNTTVCRSTLIRQRMCANQLFRGDWNPSQSESSCPVLKPWLLHT